MKQPRLEDANHYLSADDFRSVLVVVNQWIDGQLIHAGLVYVTSPNAVRVYIRDWRDSDESGTNYLDLQRSGGRWKITREYTREMRSFEG
jgi:hypothetical protein